MPVPAPTAPSITGPASAPRAASTARVTSDASTWTARPSLSHESSHSPTVGMTTSQFQNHWRRLFMTGGGTAPKLVESEVDAAKVAGETAGAITIIDRAAAGDLPVLFPGKS